MKKILPLLILTILFLLQVAVLQAQSEQPPNSSTRGNERNTVDIKRQASAIRNEVRQLEQALVTKDKKKAEKAKKMILVKMNDVIEREKRQVEYARMEEHRATIKSQEPSISANVESRNQESVERNEMHGKSQWQKGMELLTQHRQIYSDFQKCTFELTDSTFQKDTKNLALVDKFINTLEKEISTGKNTGRKEKEHLKESKGSEEEPGRKLPLPNPIEKKKE